MYDQVAKLLLVNETSEIPLDWFKGKHILTGVSQGDRVPSQSRYAEYEDADSISFIIDDMTFTFVEDPSDGYRSTLEGCFINLVNVNNTFEPLEITIKQRKVDERIYHKEADYHEEVLKDLIEFKYKGKVFAEVGTDYSDGYYPHFVSFFNPQVLGEIHEQR
jgi:hypothetical protein